MPAIINRWSSHRIRADTGHPRPAMWRWAVLALGFTVPLMACSGSARNQAAESTADVLVPEAPFSDSYAFTVYGGWRDAYQLLYNSAIGAEEFVQAVEFAPEAELSANAFGEGLSAEEIAAAERARDDAMAGASEACEVATPDPEVHLCVYPGYSFLARAFPNDGAEIWIVASYHDNPAAVEGRADPTVYNPESIEARFMAADFEPMAIDDAIEHYLVER